MNSTFCLFLLLFFSCYHQQSQQQTTVVGHNHKTRQVRQHLSHKTKTHGRQLGNTCEFAKDGTCDVPSFCSAGTDDFDCGTDKKKSDDTNTLDDTLDERSVEEEEVEEIKGVNCSWCPAIPVVLAFAMLLWCLQGSCTSSTSEMANAVLLKFENSGTLPSNTPLSSQGDISKVCGYVNPVPDVHGNATLLTSPLMRRNCVWYNCVVSELLGDDTGSHWYPILTLTKSLNFILTDNITGDPRTWSRHIFVDANTRPIWPPNDCCFVEGSTEFQTHTEDCCGTTFGSGGKPASRDLVSLLTKNSIKIKEGIFVENTRTLKAIESWLLPGTKVTMVGTVRSNTNTTGNSSTLVMNPAPKQMSPLMEGVTVNWDETLHNGGFPKQVNDDWSKLEKKFLKKLIADKAIIVSLDSKDFQLASQVQVLPVGVKEFAGNDGVGESPWWEVQNATPQSLTFNVIVPPNVVGGQKINFNANGQIIQVAVPFGVQPGMSFTIQVAQPIMTPESLRNWSCSVPKQEEVDLSQHVTKQKKKKKKKKNKKEIASELVNSEFF